MFEASHPFAFFDYFRVPYEIAPSADPQDQPAVPASVGWLRTLKQADKPRRSLFWLRSGPGEDSPAEISRLGRYRLAGFTVVGRVALDATVPGILRGLGDGWRPADAIFDADGQPVGRRLAR